MSNPELSVQPEQNNSVLATEHEQIQRWRNGEITTEVLLASLKDPGYEPNKNLLGQAFGSKPWTEANMRVRGSSIQGGGLSSMPPNPSDGPDLMPRSGGRVKPHT